MTGTERKVFQKYYPPDFDPSKLPRAKGPKNRQFVQRVMTPCNMQCNTCNEYIYKGKKFNMKRETVDGLDYLGLRLFRFYFKCPNCLAEITFRTDLENCDYHMEHGATRLFEAFKVYQEAEKQREAQEEEDKKDPMKMLEKRTMMSRAEMEAMGNLEDLQEKNRHMQGVDVDTYLGVKNAESTLSIADQLKRQEEEDERFVKDLFGQTEDGKFIRRIKDEADDGEEVDMKPSTSAVVDTKPIASSSFASSRGVDLKPSLESSAQSRKRDSQKALLSKFVVVKKKAEVEVKREAPDEHDDDTSSLTACSSGTGSTSTSCPTSSKAPVASQTSVLAGLGEYGSSSDDE